MQAILSKYIFYISLFLIIGNLQRAHEMGTKTSDNISEIKVVDINGKEISMSSYKGKVLLIVNVASKCGYTPQYEDLQKLYTLFKEKGLEILGFPCNDFGSQELGTNEQIKEFCSINYGVTFPLFDKVKILGKDKSPLYERLINSPGTEKGDVKWNFEKFLISKEGKIVQRFRSAVKPLSEELIEAVEKELKRSVKK